MSTAHSGVPPGTTGKRADPPPDPEDLTGTRVDSDTSERPKTMLESVPALAQTTSSIFDEAPHSCYSGIAKPEEGENPNGQRILRIIPENKLWPTKADRPIPRLGEVAHDQLRAFVLNEYYPCLGARSAI